jgi:hypothetical protein
VKGPNSDAQSPAADDNFDVISLTWNPLIAEIIENPEKKD